jgi:hypothetical protein
MHSPIFPTDLEILNAFALFAVNKGYNASVFNDAVIIKDVTNPNNNFRVFKSDDHYLVYTICVSAADYEYTAKCTVYLLLAEYNKSNANTTHLHLNFKVVL